MIIQARKVSASEHWGGGWAHGTGVPKGGSGAMGVIIATFPDAFAKVA